jgi:integrase
MGDSAITPRPNAPDFDALVDMTTKTISTNSARIYAATYAVWANWCESNGLDLLAINGATVYDFLSDLEVGKSTRKRYLSAMRQLARMITILDYGNPARTAAYESLKMIKTPDSDYGTTRDKHALTYEQVRVILSAWNGATLNELRNNALLNILFSTGLRRFEAVALKWRDVDIQNGVVTVAKGKGKDEPADVAILGQSCIPALLRWRAAQGDGYEHVFTQLADDSSGVVQDAPITTQRLYEIVQSTVARTGIAFAPHTARRTFITEMLLNGAMLADAQAQARHEDESMTLYYARSVNAAQRGKRLAVRW